MRHNDFALEFGLQQVIPAGGIFQTLFGEPVGVAGESDAAHIDGIPGAGGIQIGFGGLIQRGLIRLQQPLIYGGDVVIRGAAEHQRCLRVVLFGFHAGQHFTGGKTDIIDLDAGLFFKFVEIVDDFAFRKCGVNGEFLTAGGFGRLLGLGVIGVGGGIAGTAAAAGGECQQTGSGQQGGKQTLGGFLHKSFLLFSQISISIPA